MAQLPIGKKDDFKFVSVKKGDLLKLVSGETVTFDEMKRTRFTAVYNKRGLSVPLYKDRSACTPYILEVVGHNASAASPKPVSPGSLVPGNLFILEGKKGTYMFERETPTTVHRWDTSTKQSYRMRKSDFNFVRIHMAELYKELVG